MHPELLRRGVYVAPYLDVHTGRPVILIIDQRQRCLHSFTLEPGESESDGLERGRRLLWVLDPPPISRVTL